ncbi:Uncharacterised protein [Cytobacillus firmus]|nr:Uncharacterised protein [Cytobacillus firmus]
MEEDVIIHYQKQLKDDITYLLVIVDDEAIKMRILTIEDLVLNPF